MSIIRKPAIAGVFAAFFAGGLLAGCAADPGISSKVAGAVVSLTLAENAYVKTCKDVPTLAVCVEPMKQRIKDLDNTAYAAVKAAERNEALLSFAMSAIGDFTTATTAR